MQRPVGIFSPARFLLSQSAKPVMAERALRYWKGDGSCCRLANDPLWRALPFSAAPAAYAAAFSRDDLSRMIEEYSGRRPSGVHIKMVRFVNVTFRDNASGQIFDADLSGPWRPGMAIRYSLTEDGKLVLR